MRSASLIVLALMSRAAARERLKKEIRRDAGHLRRDGIALITDEVAARDVFLCGLRAVRTKLPLDKPSVEVDDPSGVLMRTPRRCGDPVLTSPIKSLKQVSSCYCSAPERAAITLAADKLERRAELVLFDHGGIPARSGLPPLASRVTNELLMTAMAVIEAFLNDELNSKCMRELKLSKNKAVAYLLYDMIGVPAEEPVPGALAGAVEDHVTAEAAGARVSKQLRSLADAEASLLRAEKDAVRAAQKKAKGDEAEVEAVLNRVVSTVELRGKEYGGFVTPTAAGSKRAREVSDAIVAAPAPAPAPVMLGFEQPPTGIELRHADPDVLKRPDPLATQFLIDRVLSLETALEDERRRVKYRDEELSKLTRSIERFDKDMMRRALCAVAADAAALYEGWEHAVELAAEYGWYPPTDLEGAHELDRVRDHRKLSFYRHVSEYMCDSDNADAIGLVANHEAAKSEEPSYFKLDELKEWLKSSRDWTFDDDSDAAPVAE